MISQRELFLRHVGQTSDAPLGIEAEKAKGIYIFDRKGKKYIDLVSGVSVSNVGHGHPKIIKAVKAQAERYMHLMVYGEYIQSPQVEYARMLSDVLPKSLNAVYFVNSGSEANEAAMKLAKRHTGRQEIIAFRNAYHGSTHGAMSLMSDSYFTQAYRPLVPGIKFTDYNNAEQLSAITEKTAAVVGESIQGEGGIIPANKEFMQALRKRCNETGTLLILDEVQTGFMRTGRMFGFMHYDIVPDMITIAKGMGGGMPIGALVTDKSVMNSFKNHPVLGHITTFGGHPVSAAAAVAALKIVKTIPEETVKQKSDLFRQGLKSMKEVADIRGKGLFLAVRPRHNVPMQQFIPLAKENGLLSDWFLFDETRFRIAPPLTISEKEIRESLDKIQKSLIMFEKL